MYGSWKFHWRGPSKPATSSAGLCAAASNGSGDMSFHAAPTSNVVAAETLAAASHCSAPARNAVDSQCLARIMVARPPSEDRQRGKVRRRRDQRVRVGRYDEVVHEQDARVVLQPVFLRDAVEGLARAAQQGADQPLAEGVRPVAEVVVVV